MRNSKIAIALILGLSITAITGGAISSVSLNINSPTDVTIEEINDKDTTTLKIEVSNKPIILWPPNHKFHTISIYDYVKFFVDGNEKDVCKKNIFITSVSSDEPENAENRDGNTSDDIIILDCQTVKLRAERRGEGNGRVYIINFDIIYESEIIRYESLEVWVPHDKGKGSKAIDDGPLIEYGYILLYEKDPKTWDIKESGAWGFLQYKFAGPEFKYFFKAKGLEPSTKYSLIYYEDPWPGNNPGAWITEGETDKSGDVYLAGSTELNMDLPHPNDDNYEEGAKIWLVLSDDYNHLTNEMTDWQPTEYLFENNLITYDDTDVAYLLLYEKDPDTWNIKEGGAYGNLKYNHEGTEFEFEFFGFGLEPGTTYSLIYYGDPWPGNHTGAFIADGISTEPVSTDLGGDIYISDPVDLDMDLPHPIDDNYLEGAKIWLVLSDDYDPVTNKMISWHPTEYLFENNLITYDDMDAP